MYSYYSLLLPMSPSLREGYTILPYWLRLGHVPCLGQWAEISHCPPQALFFPSPMRPTMSSTTRYGLFLHLGSEIKKTWGRGLANPIKYVMWVSNETAVVSYWKDLVTVHLNLTYTEEVTNNWWRQNSNSGLFSSNVHALSTISCDLSSITGEGEGAGNV